MKIIKIDLPTELEQIELHIFADEHIGDEHCDIKRLLERIEYVKSTPNAYCILNGDLLDRVILDLYMKMVCCVLHDAFGFGEKRLTYFIGNHRRLFDQQNRLVNKGEQPEYLNKRMAEIFKKDGYPQEFVDGLIGKIELIDSQGED